MTQQLNVVEIKAFVPAKDFRQSINFYKAIGFELKWSDSDLAYFALYNSSFLLQNFYHKAHAENYMMHLLVQNADNWWVKIKESNVVETYGAKLQAPQDRDWGMRDFVMIDPTGVLWRIGHNLEQ